MDDSLLIALEGLVLAPYVWMLIARWERGGLSSSKTVIYPTPLMVRTIKIVLTALLALLWLSAITDLLD